MKLSLLLFASTLFAAGFPSPTKDSSLKDLVVRLKSEELYKLEILGIPATIETPIRVTRERLKQSYVFRLEISDLNGVACGESFKDAVGRLAFKEGKGPRNNKGIDKPAGS